MLDNIDFLLKLLDKSVKYNDRIKIIRQCSDKECKALYEILENFELYPSKCKKFNQQAMFFQNRKYMCSDLTVARNLFIAYQAAVTEFILPALLYCVHQEINILLSADL